MGKRKFKSEHLTVKRPKTALSNNGSILSYLNSVEVALNDEILTVEEELGRMEAIGGAVQCSANNHIDTITHGNEKTGKEGMGR